MAEVVLETIRICKARNLLTEYQYLSSKGKEVVDIMMALLEQGKAIVAENVDSIFVHRVYMVDLFLLSRVSCRDIEPE